MKRISPPWNAFILKERPLFPYTSQRFCGAMRFSGGPMQNPRVVSIHYTLTDDTGAEIDSSRGGEPLTYLEGAGNIIPGLEKELLQASPGDRKNVKVAAKDAYGEKQEDRIVKVPRSQFPAGVEPKVGDRFRSGAEHHSPVFTVMELSADQITLDGNHPLAGKALSFDVEITNVRDATEEEVSHGHVHGEGGHHH
jgi:FKBP-type peptidyl-prolyl cis-trans isomerase SlyD